MSKHEIEFTFSRHGFDYKLPLTGVDLDFLKDRRCEVIGCMQQLAKRVKDINIATKEGVSEFSLASELVKYYYYALVVIESKQDILTNGESRKDAPVGVFTGKLSQGKYTK